tara:strand:- start:272 stop:457 length:186 start_codon:yes stop_codon:yes gene_type:complete
MQLRLKSRASNRSIINKLLIKTILFTVIFLLAIFLLDKIDVGAPSKLIKQKISNDKLIILK